MLGGGGGVCSPWRDFSEYSGRPVILRVFSEAVVRRRNILYLHPPSAELDYITPRVPGGGGGGDTFKWLVLACQDAAWGDAHHLMFQSFAVTTAR